jgi:hypothetical protein
MDEQKLGLVVIMNVFRRKQEGLYIKRLMEIAAKPLDVPVVISFDDGSLGIWKNFQQALTIGENKGTHRLIIHDDIVIDRIVLQKSIHLTKFIPENSYLSIYNPDNADYRNARVEGRRILKTDCNFWLQSSIYPDALMHDFIDWCKNNVESDYPWEDRRLAFYLKKTNKFFYSVIPGLTQHLGAFRSNFKQGGKVFGKKRYSATFDSSQDVFNIDWKSEFNNPFIATMKVDHELELTHKRNLEEGIC